MNLNKGKGRIPGRLVDRDSINLIITELQGFFFVVVFLFVVFLCCFFVFVFVFSPHGLNQLLLSICEIHSKSDYRLILKTLDKGEKGERKQTNKKLHHKLSYVLGLHGVH